MSATGDRSTGEGTQRNTALRDVLLVGLAILALIVAAFAVPPLGPSAAGSGPGPGSDAGDRSDGGPSTTTPDGADDGAGPGGDGTGSDGVRISVHNGTADRGPDGPGRTLNATAGRPHPECFVVVWDRLLPGETATVLLWNDGAYVADRRVRFDDRSIGRTDDRGRADGTVPYVRELEVEVSVPPVETCRFLHLEQELALSEWERVHGGEPIITVADDAGVEVERRNGTVAHVLPVAGDARLRVEGEPYPGEMIRLNATVDGVPMRSATVTMNGRVVGETDDRGHYDLTVPDDGTETLTLAATRGAFDARATVDVLLLSVTLRPSTLLAFPGGPATVVATVGDRPAGDVTVSVDDRGFVTTNHRGLASIRLPSDPFETVTAEGHGQTTTVPVWPVYVPTVLLGLLVTGLVAGTLVRASRDESAAGARTVAGFWVGLAVLAVAWVLTGPVGVAVLALAGLGGFGIVYRDRILAWVGHATSTVRSALRAGHGFAIRLADRLGRLADRLLAALQLLRRRLVAMPRSVRGVLALRMAWPTRLAARLFGELRRFVAVVAVSARAASGFVAKPRRLAAFAVAVVLLAAAYEEASVPATAGVAAGLLVLWFVYRWRRSKAARIERDRSGPLSGEGPTSDADAAADETWRPALRSLWRTFARWIVPGRWRSATPGEVARAAVDRGFPRESVERLTETFREVEYGEHPLSEDRYRRARSAFDDLDEARVNEEGGD